MADPKYTVQAYNDRCNAYKCTGGVEYQVTIHNGTAPLDITFCEKHFLEIRAKLTIAALPTDDNPDSDPFVSHTDIFIPILQEMYGPPERTQ